MEIPDSSAKAVLVQQRPGGAVPVSPNLQVFLFEVNQTLIMPKKMKVGRSGTTQFKQRDLEILLKNQIGRTFGVYCKFSGEEWFDASEIYYIDCTAGDMDPKEVTSPQIFMEQLKKYKNLPSRLFLVEENNEICDTLLHNYERYSLSYENKLGSIRIMRRNFRRFLKYIQPHRYRFGLIYHDPNVCLPKDYAPIFRFLNENPRMDVLLNVCTGWLNRIRPNTAKGHEDSNDFYLTTILKKINKKHIWIRNNIDIRAAKNKSVYEYVMVFGTNHKSFKLNTQNFIHIDSDEGKELIYQYNFNKKEKNEIERHQNRGAVQITLPNQKRNISRSAPQHPEQRI